MSVQLVKSILMVLLVLAASPALASSPLEHRIIHATNVGSPGFTTLVEYDFQRLHGHFNASGPLTMQVEYVADGVQFAPNLVSGTLVAHQGSTILGDVTASRAENGIVIGSAVTSLQLGRATVEISRQPIVLGFADGEVEILSTRDWLDQHVQSQPLDLTGRNNNLEPGDIPGEGREDPGRPLRCGPEESCLGRRR